MAAVLSLGVLSMLLSGCGRGSDVPAALYIGWDDEGRNRIYRLDAPDAAPRLVAPVAGTLTGDVFDFAIAPDGKTLAYSMLYDEGGSAIFLADTNGRTQRELLACPEAECAMLSWAPDGRQLVYEWRAGLAAGSVAPYLQWLDVETGETLPVIADNREPSYGVGFSAGGDWLSYVSPQDEGVVVYHLTDGRQQLYTSYTGMVPVWSPRGAQVVMSDLELIVFHGDEGDDHTAHTHDYSSAVQLFLILDPASGERSPISPDQAVDDSTPAWSADGEWLVFGRRYPDTSSGRQLWRARPDGSEAVALTADDTVQHGGASWSPDGRLLLYQRAPAFDHNARASVWMMDVETGSQTQLVAEGFQPVWLAAR